MLFHRTFHTAAGAAALIALAAQAPLPAAAQPTSRATAGSGLSPTGGDSWLPLTRRGWVGIHLGRSDYSDARCGIGSLTCDDNGFAGRISTGGMFSDHFGVELGYLNLGSADRAGGKTRAQGLNASLLAKLPVDRFSVFAKGGVTYGRTRVSSVAGSGVFAGKDDGFGKSYGVGAGYELGASSTVVLEWERHDLRFAGDSKRQVDALTLGYQHRF